MVFVKLLYSKCTNENLRLDFSVDIAMGRRVGVRFLVKQDIFFIPQRPDWFWGPPVSCPTGSGALTPRVKWQEATHLHLVPMSRMAEIYLYSPTHLHAVVFN
jgi:hypothetical protein